MANMSILMVITGWAILTCTSSWVKVSKDPSCLELSIVGGIAFCGLGLFLGGVARFLIINHVFAWIGEHCKF
jgi:hypothetical protein